MSSGGSPNETSSEDSDTGSEWKESFVEEEVGTKEMVLASALPSASYVASLLQLIVNNNM